MFRPRRRSAETSRTIGKQLKLEALEPRQMLSATPVMLTDSGGVSNTTGSAPYRFVEFDGKTFFSTAYFSGVMWQTDGSAAGTEAFGGITSYGESTIFKGSLYFTGREVNGNFSTVFRLDPGASEPTQVGGFNNSPSYPRNFCVVGDWLYFLTPASNSVQLWRTDGTEAGTQVVKTISTIASSGISTNEHRLKNINGTLFFKANDGVSGPELWKSDGTAAGTMLVRDIRPGSAAGIPSMSESSSDDFVVMDGALYFAANDGASGRELWRSDGTEAGTYRVADLAPGSSSSSPANLFVYGSTLLFTAGSSLWKTDGTVAGTMAIRALGSTGVEIEEMNGLVYFAASGFDLWKTDGTVAGTSLVKNIWPGGNESPKSLTNVNGTLYFSANDGTHGVELWQSDGTAAGTTQLPDLYPSTNFSPTNLTNVNGKLYFAAIHPAGGAELFRLGDDGAVRFVKDLLGSSKNTSSEPSSFANLNGQLLFQANEMTSLRRWITDGTSAGTMTITGPAFLQSAPFSAATAGDWTYFVARDDVHGAELWKTNGTAAGTGIVKDIRAGSAFAETGIIFTNVNGTLYFLANDANDNYGLWKSDGTEAGTTQVKDFQNEGTSYAFSFSTRSQFLAVNDLLYFVATNGTRKELWRSNGTSAGTFAVADYEYGPIDLTNLNGVLYYAAYDPAHGVDLWRSDGTAEGTHIVKDIQLGPYGGVYSYANSTISELAGELYFFVTISANQQGQLWKSDGTEAGTIPVAWNSPNATVPTGYYNLDPGFTVAGSSLYFVYPGVGSLQLFKLTAGDSTPVQVSNFSSQREPPFEQGVLVATNVNGTLYFVANDGASGSELWRTVGGGVARVADLRPGSQGATIANLMNVAGDLYFTADDGSHGKELWVVRPQAPIAGDYNDNGRVDGADFLAWQRDFGSAATPAGSGADGDGDGTIAGGDLAVWKGSYGAATIVVAEAMAASDALPSVAAAIMASEEFESDALDDDAPQATARDRIFAAGDFSRLYAAASESDGFRERWRKRR
ncbi:ELWxxDGT repeat protein [Lacipirellula sp.]|uniref:ELWxxDGT repeat protein n=1 Tax=Lacipirellula sp. TaxID=2691419 RepID=UPI003D0BC4FB